MAVFRNLRRGNIRAMVRACRTRRTVARACSHDVGATNIITVRSSSSKLREAHLGFFQREGELQNEDTMCKTSAVFPSCSPLIQRFLNEVFASTCELVPLAIVAEVQLYGQHYLHGAFSDIASACQDFLSMDAKQRLDAICKSMAQWSNSAQTALAAIVARTSACTEESIRKCRVGGEEHRAACTIFALQLKLQASARLMDDDCVRQVLEYPQVLVPQRGKGDHDVEASAEIHAPSSRRKSDRIVPVDSERRDPPQLRRCPTFASDASIFREALDDIQSNESLLGGVETNAAINVPSLAAKDTSIDLRCMSADANPAMNTSIVRGQRGGSADGESARVDIELIHAAFRPTYPTLLSTSARLLAGTSDADHVSSSRAETIEVPGILQRAIIATPRFSVS